MKRIVFVCEGNICRSPMAEFIFKKMVRAAGKEKEFEIDSAATSKEDMGQPVYPMARQELAKHGIGCPGKVSRHLLRSDYQAFDMIIGMDASNLASMRKICAGDPQKKMSLLLDHTPESDVAHHGRDVSDPWYTRKFDVAWDDIYAGCSALFEKLTSNG